MKIIFKILLIGITTLISCTSRSISTKSKNENLIKWVNKLNGDFSFKNKWSYPEGIYINAYGQLSCDGFCPKRIDQMKDETGRIIEDSLEVFYSIMDTSHIYHSLKSSNKMYENSGTNFINFALRNNKIIGKTTTNASTHSTLTIELDDNSFDAFVDFNSIRDLGKHRFSLSNGNLEIDTMYYNEGIIKAFFEFEFHNSFDQSKELFWKGQIFSKIKKE